MFCYQCEQTAKGEGCVKGGVCGKLPDVAALQDLLTYALIGLSLVAAEGRKVGVSDHEINVFTCEALFSTLTNVNFDTARFISLVKQCVEYRNSLINKIKAAGGKVDHLNDRSINYEPAASLQDLITQGEQFGVKSYPAANADILSLKHTLLFGIRGIAAYMDHARILGQEDDAVYSFIHEGLAALMNGNLGLDETLNLVLKCGEMNLRAMELLDTAHTGTYGHPVPTKVPLAQKKGRQFSYQAMISKTLKNYSNRQRVRASMSIPMVKCYPVTAIPASKSMITSMAIMEQPGRIRLRNLPNSPALFS